MICKYCKKDLLMTDDFGDIQLWECMRENKVFKVKTGKKQTHNHITGKVIY